MFGSNRFGRRILSFNRRNNSYSYALATSGIKINNTNSTTTTTSYMNYIVTY